MQGYARLAHGYCPAGSSTRGAACRNWAAVRRTGGTDRVQARSYDGCRSSGTARVQGGASAGLRPAGTRILPGRQQYPGRGVSKLGGGEANGGDGSRASTLLRRMPEFGHCKGMALGGAILKARRNGDHPLCERTCARLRNPAPGTSCGALLRSAFPESIRRGSWGGLGQPRGRLAWPPAATVAPGLSPMASQPFTVSMRPWAVRWR